MEIAKLEKHVNYQSGVVRLSVDIEISMDDCAVFDYTGLDCIPDESIPDILTAVGRMYSGKIKAGRILQEKVGSLI